MGAVMRRSGAERGRARLGVVLLATLALVLVALLVYSTVELARFARAGARRTAAVYAAAQPLLPGVHLQRVNLAATLGRLNYTATREAPRAPGQFRRTPEGWEIFVRGVAGRTEPGLVGLAVDAERIVRVTRGGREVTEAALEPEVLAGAGDRPGEDSRPIRLDEVPRPVVDAVLAAEDQRFFTHGGLDARALVRAAWRNLAAGGVREGGSTITQQLVKVRLLGPRRTFGRKLREAWLALLVERQYSKAQILEAYLNEIYLGQRGGVALRGIGAAARGYFGTEVHRLSLGEAALLAGMVRAPNAHAPDLHPERARARRDRVLDRMRALRMIGEAAHARARREPVTVRRASVAAPHAPYLLDHVRQEFEQRFGDDLARYRDVRVYTALDLTLQRFAEDAVTRGLDRLESAVPALRARDGRRLQAALVALDPATGAVRALVGGRSYAGSQFNRATQARRQPGSAFKPFVYLAALRSRGGAPVHTAASLVEDAPLTLTVDGRPWTPRNYDDRYEGRVTVRRALEQSLNTATVRIAEQVGLPAVVETARDVGLRSELHPVPALALGAFEVTPLELARAYATLASGGIRPAGAFAILSVHDRDGEVAPAEDVSPVAAISPAEAYLVTSLLEGVVSAGTGSALVGLGVTTKVAGKTGTTNEGRDAWFAGYTPRLLTVVWVGYDGREPHGFSGAQAALPIWADFMKAALDAYPDAEYTPPPGIAFAQIDPTTGKLAGRLCPVVVREVFLAGTEPPPCDEHQSVVDRVRGWWDRLRGWFRSP
jgi:penicillin-binding protein 1B